MHTILVLSQHRIRIGRIQNAFNGLSALKIVHNINELRSTISNGYPDLIVLDVKYCDNSIGSLVHLLHTDRPHSSIILYIEGFCKAHIQSVLECGRAGASAVLIYDIEDTPERIRNLLPPINRTKVDYVGSLISSNVKSLYVKRYVKPTFTFTKNRVPVSEICADMKVSRQHIARECRTYNLPPPEWIACLPRLTRLCLLLDKGMYKKSFLANELDFASITGMKHHIRVHLQTDIDALIQKEAYEWLVSTVRSRFNIPPKEYGLSPSRSSNSHPLPTPQP